jgi:hypothetical protein
VPLSHPCPPYSTNPKQRSPICVVCPGPKRAKTTALASITCTHNTPATPKLFKDTPSSPTLFKEAPCSPKYTPANEDGSEGVAFMLKEPDQPCMDVIISPDHSAFSLKAIREYTYEIVNSFYDGGDKDQ